MAVCSVPCRQVFHRFDLDSPTYNPIRPICAVSKTQRLLRRISIAFRENRPSLNRFLCVHLARRSPLKVSHLNLNFSTKSISVNRLQICNHRFENNFSFTSLHARPYFRHHTALLWHLHSNQCSNK